MADNTEKSDLHRFADIKQHINRPKDRDSIFQLLAIKRIQQEKA